MLHYYFAAQFWLIIISELSSIMDTRDKYELASVSNYQQFTQYFQF